MRVLLVEDDSLLGEGVHMALKQEGYVVDWLKDGEQADFALKNESFDMAVIDIGLPKKDGFQVLNNMRKRGDNTSVLILTARETVEDRVRGLDIGADDYLTKPFDLDELCARLRALKRRLHQSSGNQNLLTHGDITVDTDAQQAYYKGELLSMSRREYALLEKLLENPNRVLSRDYLTQILYGWEDEIDSNAIEVHVHNLRKKTHASYIKTIRGVGYMLTNQSTSS